MTLEDDLIYQKEQLLLVRKQITKLRSTHVSSYGFGGNSATYRGIDDLVKDESRIINHIARLDASIGKTTSSISNRVFKGFTRFS